MQWIVREYARADSVMAEHFGLPPEPHGMLFVVLADPGRDGEHLTVATTDIAHHEKVISTGDVARMGSAVDPSKYPLLRAGWPNEWPAAAAPWDIVTDL